jgi:hypothetical protein
VDRVLLIRKQRGLYAKLAQSQGAGGSQPSDRTWVFQIRSRVDRNGTRRPPHDQIPTLQIQYSSVTCHLSDLNRMTRNLQTRIGILLWSQAVDHAINGPNPSFSPGLSHGGAVCRTAAPWPALANPRHTSIRPNLSSPTRCGNQSEGD